MLAAICKPFFPVGFAIGSLRRNAHVIWLEENNAPQSRLKWREGLTVRPHSIRRVRITLQVFIIRSVKKLIQYSTLPLEFFVFQYAVRKCCAIRASGF